MTDVDYPGQIENIIEADSSAKKADGPVENPYSCAWWLIIMLVGWVWVIYLMASNVKYLEAFDQIKNGIPLTSLRLMTCNSIRKFHL